jgi:hypothetical protein
VTVEVVTRVGEYGARVHHIIPKDPLWGSYFSLVEVILPDKVRVGTPLACPQPLTNLEVQSVAQLLLECPITINPQPMDTIDDVGEKGCPRCWRAYEYSNTL